MADFKLAYQQTVAKEGGYVNDQDDPGCETYKGISFKNWPKWNGWIRIEQAKRLPDFPKNLEANNELQSDVEFFYRVQFWDKLRADLITDQQTANSLFDFAVNAGLSVSVSLAQLVAGANADGLIGPETIDKINQMDPEFFQAAFTVAKIARYVTIVQKRPVSRKYFYGWVCRALNHDINV